MNLIKLNQNKQIFSISTCNKFEMITIMNGHWECTVLLFPDILNKAYIMYRGFIDWYIISLCNSLLSLLAEIICSKLFILRKPRD